LRKKKEYQKGNITKNKKGRGVIKKTSILIKANQHLAVGAMNAVGFWPMKRRETMTHEKGKSTIPSGKGVRTKGKKNAARRLIIKREEE